VATKDFWYSTPRYELRRNTQLAHFKVEATDTTGCGDVFHGAYAFGLSRNLPLERAPLGPGLRPLAGFEGKPGGPGPDGIPSFQMVAVDF